jgi:hypothetical protein
MVTLELGKDALDIVGLAKAVDHDIAACGSNCTCDAQAYAARGTGDDCNTPCERPRQI